MPAQKPGFSSKHWRRLRFISPWISPKSNCAISAIPGIAISGFGNNGDIERSLQAGFSEHLIKPIKLDDLEAAIERAIGLT
ncbi:MAG: hypothetical protein DMF01_10450 [Verrucomicrobia bacterium]|nr:MAG: hypothetical protein DMF01_10450 [Verrucomicrobiota bacterium]